ncbi:MAG: hypothetical protein ACOYJ1_16810 [Peptococcales bacterium]|jgi:hypothetical protein
MAKSALEKAIEKKQKEEAKNIQKKIQADKRLADKQQRETNKHARLEARRTSAASIVNGQPTCSGMKIVDKTAEELIKILCDGFHGNEEYRVTNHDVEIPVYIKNNLELEFEKLKQYGLVSNYVVYTSDFWETCILPCLLTYVEDKERAVLEEKQKQSSVSIGTINAHNGNVVIGDVINSSLSVDNSIHNIKKMIDEKGGDDKEELTALLEEFKDVLDNIENSHHIPKNKGFINRISAHLDKHGWFYAEIVGLLGSVAMKILMGS